MAKESITEFLKEDIGRGDLASEIIFAEPKTVSGKFVAKESGIFAGGFVLGLVYEVIGGAEVTLNVLEGQAVSKGEVIAEVRGDVKTLLQSERVILNLVQRMSGIATATAETVQALGDSNIKVCDTRKTAPGLRAFDKYAVRVGGGANHRFGLDDAVMLKENHILAAGGILPALTLLRKNLGLTVKVEVETTNADEVREVLQAPSEFSADIIMFDHATPEDVREYVGIVKSSNFPQTITEVSGNITAENIAQYHGTGVNMVSLGSLTHSVQALDISFLLN